MLPAPTQTAALCQKPSRLQRTDLYQINTLTQYKSDLERKAVEWYVRQVKRLDKEESTKETTPF